MTWTPELIMMVAQLVMSLLPYAKELIQFFLELIKSLQVLRKQEEEDIPSRSNMIYDSGCKMETKIEKSNSCH